MKRRQALSNLGRLPVLSGIPKGKWPAGLGGSYKARRVIRANATSRIRLGRWVTKSGNLVSDSAAIRNLIWWLRTTL
jgi:hypothetical protein